MSLAGSTARALPPLAPTVAPTHRATAAHAGELLVVDPRVDGREALLRAARDRVAVLVLDAERDGLAQIAEALERRRATAVHLVAHGEPGALLLGSTVLTAESARAHVDVLGRWFGARAPFEARPDVLVYGCSAAWGARGAALLEALRAATGADVAGSVDATGGAAFDANWALEAALGAIEATLPFDPAAARAYPGTLEVFQVSNTKSSGPGSLSQAIADSEANDNDEEEELDVIVFTTAGCADPDVGDCGGVDAATLLTDGTVTGTISLAATLDVGESLLISGPGATELEIVGDGATSAFDVTGYLDVRDLTVADGGGAFSVVSGRLRVERCVITGQDSPSDGGAIAASMESFVTVVDSTITQNHADDGGAIFLDSSDAWIERSSLEGNTAAFEGGAILVQRGVLELVDSVIAGNTALGAGGGIYAGGDGYSSGYAMVHNSTISGNMASNGGAGIALGGHSAAEIVHATITANVQTSDSECRAAGLDLCHIVSGEVLVRSSIISGNSGATEDVDIQVLYAPMDRVVAHASILGAVEGMVAMIGSTVIDTDPMVGPLEANGGPTATHALLEGSPAIDFGTNPLGFAFDQRGATFPRVAGTRADAGAFESAFSAGGGGGGGTGGGAGGGSGGGAGGGAGGGSGGGAGGGSGGGAGGGAGGGSGGGSGGGAGGGAGGGSGGPVDSDGGVVGGGAGGGSIVGSPRGGGCASATPGDDASSPSGVAALGLVGMLLARLRRRR